jgi:hypothetical protein
MDQSQIVSSFMYQLTELRALGFNVSPTHNGFYIEDKKTKTMVGDCQTVDGLRAFAQAVTFLKQGSK